MPLSSRDRRHRARNQSRGCEACGRPRRETSRYCTSHYNKSRLHGHPAGKPLHHRLPPYVQQAEKFIQDHPGHPAIAAAEKWLGDILRAAGHSRRTDATRELDRLHQQGLDGPEALRLVLAVWLLAYFDSRALPDDRRLTFAIAHALLRSRPRTPLVRVSRNGKHYRTYRQLGARVHGDIGGMIRRQLGLFFRNVTASLEAKAAQEGAVYSTLATAFPSSPSTPQGTPNDDF